MNIKTSELKKIVSWNEFNNEYRKAISEHFDSIDALLSIYSSSLDWKTCNNWEDLEDISLLSMLKELKMFDGELFVITEASYKKECGPFYLKSEGLDEFVCQHLKLFGECFFNGDVLIFCFELDNVWLFHHERRYTSFSLKK